MNAKLSERQLAALRFIEETPGKSGGFYADFGHRPQTIAALWKRNLVETLPDQQIGFKYARARWIVTASGRATLSAAQER